MTRFGFCMFLLCLPSMMQAQSFIPNPDWRFDNFNSQNHFLSREIASVVTDKYGYVWACSSGVQRFDGYKTIDFNSFDDGRGAIKDNYTSAITDTAGRVWLSSAGLCYFDDREGRFIYIHPGKHPDLTYAYALSCQKDQLWFVCDYGLARLDLRSLKITFTALTTVTDPICTYQLNDSTLLVTSREKVYRYNIKTDSYSAITLTYNNALLKIFAVAENGTGTYLGTNSGLFLLKNVKDISLVCADTKDLAVYDMVFLPADKEKKYLFLATGGQGLKVYNTENNKIGFSYAHDESNPYSLPDNVLSCLFADKSGRLWIGTGLGISMLDVTGQQMKMRFLGPENTGEFSITKIARDKYDSTKVWMSVDNRGMVCMDWATKKVEHVFNAGGELQKIYDFEQVSKHSWLIATRKKVIEWRPGQGIIAQKMLPVSDSLRLLYNIRGLVMAGEHTCYLTTNRGLFQYDLDKHLVSAVLQRGSSIGTDRLKNDLLSGFCDHGMLWIASRNGLFCFDTATQATTVYRGEGGDHDYYFFNVAKGPGNLIICASRNGLAIFDKQKAGFQIIRSIANFYKPYCTSVLDINQTLWINSETGLLNYNLVTHTSERAIHESLLTDILGTSPIARIGHEFVVGIRNGYAYFSPGAQNISTPSNPVIERVYVNNQPLFQTGLTQAKDHEIAFDHADNSINIVFTAFLYTDADHIKFRYQLKNIDTKWQYAQSQRSANYAQLPPGSYSFYLQSGLDGNWNQRAAVFYFIIKPPYWATWWFRAIVTLAIILGLYGLYRYRIKHLLAIQRIRERIASDFHDDIGAALSSISIYSEVADTQLEEHLPHEQVREIIRHISHQSHSMLDTMDDIIWAVNPQNDHFADLVVRMREFAIPLLEARNIKFDIDIPGDLLTLRIPMEARKNIFLVFKESVNNLVKHSCCSHMKVIVSRSNGWFELLISDNGKGFDVSAPHNRNGLKNMHKRAGEIKGKIEITSCKGKGTTTRLMVNIV